MTRPFVPDANGFGEDLSLLSKQRDAEPVAELAKINTADVTGVIPIEGVVSLRTEWRKEPEVRTVNRCIVVEVSEKPPQLSVAWPVRAGVARGKDVQLPTPVRK